MRRIVATRPGSHSLLLPPGARVRRDARNLAGVISLPGGTELSACLSCQPAPCLEFAESPGGAPVCPVSAIASSPSDGRPVVSDACIACGLCALRCPLGALSEAGASIDVAEPPPASAGIANGQTDLAEFVRVGRTSRWEHDDDSGLCDRLAEGTSTLSQDAFYPLTANLFRAAGFDARLGRRGDTANRIDLTIVTDGDAIPVEIKSPTETRPFSVKSIQQALENKVVLTARQHHKAKRTSSSLVVALDPPAARSDVTELVDDVWSAFSVSIGLVPVAELWRAALYGCRGESLWTWETLANARGLLATY